MITAAALAEAYKRNVMIAHEECAGLTHADSLLQPQPRGNCLNWVLGHMLTGRNNVLRALNAPFVVEETSLVRYRRESEPITGDEEGVLLLEQLLALLSEGQEHISALLGALSVDESERPAVFTITGKEQPLSRLLFFLYFHDSYHVGQASYLRQLAGKNDKII